jgi:7-carboxy-7-deazaguanine synthase
MFRVSEIFLSIQGEGLNIGKPMIFLRFYGCNLRCAWCDTTYSYTPEGHLDEEAIKLLKSTSYQEMSHAKILREITKFSGCKTVCVTGGEPMIQPLKLLFNLFHDLKRLGYYIQIQTNGTFWDTDVFNYCDFISMDMKPPSSKMKSEIGCLQNLNLYFEKGQACEVKVVVSDAKDLEFALKEIYPNAKMPLILQPEGGKNIDWIMAAIVEKYPNVRLLPQLHRLYRWK